MKELLGGRSFTGARGLVTTLLVVVSLFAPASRAKAGCGCMDVALVIDDTGSMGGALASVQAEMPQVIAAALSASGGDLRMGLVTFPNDNVVVNVPFTTDINAVQNAIQALVAFGGAGIPESSDECLQYVITGAADPSCTVSNGPFGTFRSRCVKIAVLITDAPPGECSDTFTLGVSDVHAHSVAVAALDSNVLISAIYVPTMGEDPEIKAIMQDYATTSGGEFLETASVGTGAGEGISEICITCGALTIPQCTTRNSHFWFTHSYGTSTNCANLLDAIRYNGGQMNLGFVRLPVTYENGDSSLDSTDAVMEAMGFYWKSNGRTGEDGGTQNQKLPASRLCKQRKKLSAELIAATANVRLLRTQPGNCTYFNGVTVTNFPSDLLVQARNVAAGNDPAACQAMTVLLQKFNNNKSGLTNNFVGGLVECSPVPGGMSRSLSRDPTTRVSCPGINNSCDTAEAVVFPSSSNPFAAAKFSETVSLANPIFFGGTNALPAPTCGVGGPGVVWKITPDMGKTNRQFTASTSGSNFGALLQVWSGSCSNLVAVTNGCSAGVPPLNQARVSFSTDGTNTFYIVGESASGAAGKLTVHITSP